MASVKNSMRNKTAEMAGNYLVIDEIKTYITLMEAILVMRSAVAPTNVHNLDRLRSIVAYFILTVGISAQSQ